MRDDVRKGPAYDDDFYAWTQHQAAVLREMPVADNRFDRDNVAEELETLGREQRDTIRYEVRHVIKNFLKLQFLAANRERFGWMHAIAKSRNCIGDRMTPTLKGLIEADLPRLYCHGRELAEFSFQEAGRQDVIGDLPATCPYSLEQLLQKRWYPEPEVTR